MSIVHIKISDKGWILEKMARELTNRLSYITYDTTESSTAKIQYYMTYGCHAKRVSPFEIAYFTHKEKVESAANKFNKIAKCVDLCVAQSIATHNELVKINISDSIIISPGVDLERFNLKLKIGVVGRTYHTGRKGESIVADVMDIPGIEWVFTGTGWPGSSEYIADDALPEFYRSLDYLLVPSLIEGGPMSVLEALACGCKVISGPVGWVPQYPHIEFELGNSLDLRRVLIGLLEEKSKLRESVVTSTWDNWAKNHDELFFKLFESNKLIHTNNLKRSDAFKSLILTHGSETTASQGGPSVRAPLTSQAIGLLGYSSEYSAGRNIDFSKFDVIQIMNVWPPESCEATLMQCKMNNAASVLSSIYLDLSEIELYRNIVPNILKNYDDELFVKTELEQLKLKKNSKDNYDFKNGKFIEDYERKIRKIIKLSDHVILLSNHERNALSKIVGSDNKFSVIKNPVNYNAFLSVDNNIFKNKYNLNEYILCVGRIEPRKNQAMLAFAMKDTGIKIVFVGHNGDEKYADLVKEIGGENVIFTGRLEPESELLKSAYSGASVFCLPSWCEGAPLAALEAAASGCNLVLSNKSSEKEYFGELALYVDPLNPQEIKSQILYALSIGNIHSEALQELIKKEHSFEKYAQQTVDAYNQAINVNKQNKSVYQSTLNDAEDNSINDGYIYVDLTTMAHHKGPPSGIARVESRIAEELCQRHPEKVKFMFWNSHLKKYLNVTKEILLDKRLNIYSGIAGGILQNSPNAPFFNSEIDFKESDKILIMGSAWLRNANYIKDIKSLKKYCGVQIISTIYDVIQHKLAKEYPEDAVKQFRINCAEIIKISDQILTCSMASKNDCNSFCIDMNLALPNISVVKLADEPFALIKDEELQIDLINKIPNNSKYVLYVSSIDARKNHKLLVDVWNHLTENNSNSDIPYLVFVGNKGWGNTSWDSNEIIDYINRNIKFNNKIIMLNGINDKSLDYLYKNCLFTLYPSLYEGWGLPVAESLNYGKFCIASSAGSLSEVDKNYVVYIDPKDFMGWYKTILIYIKSSEQLRKKEKLIANYVPTLWKDTAQNIYEIVLNSNGNYAYNFDEINKNIMYSLNNNIGNKFNRDCLIGGWGNAEANGTWTVGHSSIMAFQFFNHEGSAIFVFSAIGLVASNDEFVNVDVLINDIKCAEWKVKNKKRNYYVNTPENLISDLSAIKVEFIILNPLRPVDLNPKSNDERLLGIKLIEFGIFNSVDDFVAIHISKQNEPSTLNKSLVLNSKPLSVLNLLNEINNINTLSDEEFIKASYNLVLGRNVDPPGLEGNLENLASGATRKDILRGLFESDEAILLGVSKFKNLMIQSEYSPRRFVKLRHYILGIKNKLGKSG